MTPHPSSIPTFAVVGRVNTGKTATLATLLEVDDNEVLRVSSTPGETTQVQVLPISYDGSVWMNLLDTPGFQNPIEAMREIQAMAEGKTPGPAELLRFIDQAASRFPDEVALLKPLMEGAGVLYVVDPSKPLRDGFLAEMEILRWTGRPRLALLNPQAEVDPALDHAWRERLGACFNLVRTFDAHAARYPERRKLLEALLQIEERHAANIHHIMDAMDNEQSTRREESAEAIISFIEKSLRLRVSEPIEERDQQVESRREKIRQRLTEKYSTELAKLELKATQELLKIHRHHLLKPDIDPRQHQGLDLTTAETWRKWGLTRSQLVAAGALAGGTAGAVFDLGVGIHGLGAGTVIGALGGGAAAFFKGNSLPQLRVKIGGGFGLSTSDGATMVVGPPASDNFPWILLDSMLIRYRGIQARAHGRRDATVLSVQNESGFSRHLSHEERKALLGWFTGCLKNSPDRAKEPDAYQVILQQIEKIAE
jgi:Domain of unknown function (DUF3482)/50S ribosome-binding GTPase